MNKGKSLPWVIPQSTGAFFVAVLGNTTSAPTIPADGRFTPTTSVFPRRANGVSLATADIPTRTSAGIYTATYSHALPQVLFATAVVLSAGASPTTALVADCTIVDPVTRIITVKVQLPNGTLTDLGVNDMLVLRLDAIDSTV